MKLSINKLKEVGIIPVYSKPKVNLGGLDEIISLGNRSEGVIKKELLDIAEECAVLLKNNSVLIDSFKAYTKENGVKVTADTHGMNRAIAGLFPDGTPHRGLKLALSQGKSIIHGITYYSLVATSEENGNTTVIFYKNTRTLLGESSVKQGVVFNGTITGKLSLDAYMLGELSDGQQKIAMELIDTLQEELVSNNHNYADVATKLQQQLESRIMLDIDTLGSVGKNLEHFYKAV